VPSKSRRSRMSRWSLWGRIPIISRCRRTGFASV
jgi:hypothetical protein